MEAIIGQLGLNISFIFQFITTIILFFVAKHIFINKLQFIIENREEKTVKLESSADNIFERANTLSQKYNQRINEAKIDSQKRFNEEKSKIIKENDYKLKEAEKDIEKFIENARRENEDIVRNKKTEVLSKAEELSELLVNKIQTRH